MDLRRVAGIAKTAWADHHDRQHVCDTDQLQAGGIWNRSGDAFGDEVSWRALGLDLRGDRGARRADGQDSFDTHDTWRVRWIPMRRGCCCAGSGRWRCGCSGRMRVRCGCAVSVAASEGAAGALSVSGGASAAGAGDGADGAAAGGVLSFEVEGSGEDARRADGSLEPVHAGAEPGRSGFAGLHSGADFPCHDSGRASGRRWESPTN